MAEAFPNGFPKDRFESNMISEPVVTVLMSVYNGSRFLPEAIQSILQQTFTDFEFLIIDDGSQDDSIEIVRSFSDSRIRLLCNGTNLGLMNTLNLGLDQARGKYIARFDADDISLPARLEKQVNFLETHPEFGLCGTWFQLFGRGRTDIIRLPTEDRELKPYLLFGSPFCHPSIMLNKSLFHSYGLQYNPTLRYSQDYELWERSSRYLDLANLPEILLWYRVHTSQASHEHKAEQESAAARVRFAALGRLGIKPDAEEIRIHSMVSLLNETVYLSQLSCVEAWLQKLRAANHESSLYDPIALNGLLGIRWFYICILAAHLGRPVWEKFYHSTLRVEGQLPVRYSVSLAIKCLLRRSPRTLEKNQT